MPHMNCDRDCDHCPFVVDPNDPQRYACLKCGKEYSFEPNAWFGAVVVMLLVVLLTYTLYGETASRQQRRLRRSLRFSESVTLTATQHSQTRLAYH